MEYSASISVIVPCYNSEETVCKTLESILRQTLRPVEIVVVNDGSTDGSADVVRSVMAGNPDAPIMLVEQANLGVSAARNRGVRECHGDFITFLDADDLWTATRLEKQLAALLSVNPTGYAVAVTGIIRFVESRSGDFDCFNETCFRLPPSESRLAQTKRVLAMNNGEMAVGSTVMCLKKAFWDAGGWDTELRIAEDWDLLLRLCQTLPLVSVEEPLLLYRKHPVSATATFRDYSILEKQQYRMITRYARAGGLNGKELKELRVAHLLDFLGITQNALTFVGRVKRVALLVRLAAIAPSSLGTRVFYRHIRKTIRLATR